MKFINNVNFNKKQLKNAVVELINGSPASPVEGQIWFNTGVTVPSNKGLYIYKDGSTSKLTDQSMTTQQIVTALESYGAKINIDVDTLDGQSGSHYLNRSNHTGTQTASTISDLATTVKGYKLNEFAAPDGSLNLNSQKITGLGTPTANSTDAATTQYVDAKVSDYAKGLDAKESVLVVVTTNLSPLSGFPTIDGTQYFPGSRILLTAQTTSSENGVYIVEAGSWSKAPDATGSNLTKGAYVLNEKDGSAWAYIGGANETWTKFSEGTLINAGTGISVSTVGTTSTISVNTNVVARKVSADVGGSTQVTITHNLGTEDVTVSLREKSGSKAFVLADVEIVDSNNVKFIFDEAPTSAQYRATIIG